MAARPVHRLLGKTAFLVVTACQLLWYPSAQAQKSPIAWRPATIAETMSPGEMKTVGASFTSTVPLSGASLWVSPGLQPFVGSLVPAAFGSVAGGTEYVVLLTFSIPPDALPGIYGGTAHLRVGNRTYPMPLKIELTVEEVANFPPVANAGPDQTVTVGATVRLDGSASSDVDGHPLTYAWAFVSTPAGSGAVLADPTTVTPTFVADRPGAYVVQLIVNDGVVDSTPDTVVISTVNSRPVADAGRGALAIAGTVLARGSYNNTATRAAPTPLDPNAANDSAAAVTPGRSL